VNFQAAAVRVVIRLLAAAAVYALAMKASRGAGLTQQIDMTIVPAAGFVRPLMIERSNSTESAGMFAPAYDPRTLL
jgi:hypothetical protein